MAVNTEFQIPFLPQTGITQQILGAIQLANEHNIARQRLALQQQAQPSEIALRQAQTGEVGAETAAIPERLKLEQQRIESETELRKATLNLEQQWRMGSLGLAQTKESRITQENAQKLALSKEREVWENKLADARIKGIGGNLALHSEALQQLKQYQGQEVQLRQQAIDLQAQGRQIEAEQAITQADHVANQTGIVRSILGELGAVPTFVPPTAQSKPTGGGATPAKTPARPKGVPADYNFDNATRTWRPPQ